ncbi:MAG: hypothetical protein RI983_681 [Bacteroidota bacterium]|jgi:hypothetical protein
MKIKMRNGYENYESDFKNILQFLSAYDFIIDDNRTDGSYYLYSIKLNNSKIKSIRFYHEFIEQQLLVTIMINDNYYTTLELNKNKKYYNEKDLKPNGDDYINALKNNAEIIKMLL